jgi:hypothetical protein
MLFLTSCPTFGPNTCSLTHFHSQQKRNRRLFFYPLTTLQTKSTLAHRPSVLGVVVLRLS